ncbi:Enoyl-CoA delta isomerase 2, mitochondrial [Portunus trituberculatus]|uniref:Enoyl-CoA delta isomerase 2, mitochondrial n=1 Tax=Portunus trituberculatus TaxID=210409 RepID=A0A5B7J4C9_PORTR|nr:Enoyl-CoA delta isomerase 2, mitochondrial [Portunus trituberculatus]
MMSSLPQQFDDAKTRLGSLKEDPGNETKLKIYALFKQATTGSVTTKRPGMMDFVGRAKWDAWNALGNMTQEEAQKAYIQLVDSLVGAEVSCMIGIYNVILLCQLICFLNYFYSFLAFYFYPFPSVGALSS